MTYGISVERGAPCSESEQPTRPAPVGRPGNCNESDFADVASGAGPKFVGDVMGRLLHSLDTLPPSFFDGMKLDD